MEKNENEVSGSEDGSLHDYKIGMYETAAILSSWFGLVCMVFLSNRSNLIIIVAILMGLYLTNVIIFKKPFWTKL